ncbi:hypothetical protein C7974DRAFT_381274 [Boeremia exigua]|uniref:uncharacterized protein n=1 Tax=Boeremia exigua TaxID=749465 RepID=UPI001E8CA5CE|nr:uncharacterized protein C7974DRAFT_381274 [Boeremia exigua]KAH6612772.1 hypothetical protein C7974DRAFT_381274 [Boeremia exigua]
MHFLAILSASAAFLSTAFAAPAKGGTAKAPAVAATASVTVYPSYTCVDHNTVRQALPVKILGDVNVIQQPPTSDGTGKTWEIAQAQCVIANIPVNGAVTARLTAPAKSGVAGCYLQLFKEQGCGVTLTNQYHGFPFNGVSTGNSVGCAAPPVQSYGAFTVVCD